MIQALILICAAGLDPAVCTAATAEHAEVFERRMGLVECLIGGEAVMAAKADPGVAYNYVKIVCQGSGP